MANRMGVLIIGTGWVAGEHVKAYLADPRTEIRGLCDLRLEKAEEARRSYGLDCPVAADYRRLLDRDDIQVVDVCTAHNAHYEQARDALEAGKHTFVEKPLCLTFGQARHLLDLTERTGLKTAVGFVARWYSAIKGLKEMADSGAIGEPFYVESDYWHEVGAGWKSSAGQAGSALLTGGVHAVDLMRYFQLPGAEAQEVFAYSVPARRRPDFSYDPTFALMVRFANGSIGRVGTSLEPSMPYVFHLMVLGTKGAIRGPGIYSEDRAGQRAFMTVPGVYPDNPDVAHHPFDEEISYFVDCIVQDREPMIGIRDAYKTHEIVFAAEHSARTGLPVRIPYAGQ